MPDVSSLRSVTSYLKFNSKIIFLWKVRSKLYNLKLVHEFILLETNK